MSALVFNTLYVKESENVFSAIKLLFYFTERNSVLILTPLSMEKGPTKIAKTFLRVIEPYT